MFHSYLSFIYLHTSSIGQTKYIFASLSYLLQLIASVSICQSLHNLISTHCNIVNKDLVSKMLWDSNEV